ncbi:hypothetical protein G8C92_08165 [Paenibacillus donghaensis]|uniref:hypothetical protein n=1 Tax=Paenibacillus donghaensis TaxID=414771 RepID=UPI001883CDE8|nr:hypothetical protein [Paenibacillus donghaensis]MBE9914007.1 hypothetical protein [Paenibacillus donghaensis]
MNGIMRFASVHPQTGAAQPFVRSKWDDHHWDQFAWLFLVFLVFPVSGSIGTGNGRFGGVDAAELKLTYRTNHHVRKPSGAIGTRLNP